MMGRWPVRRFGSVVAGLLVAFSLPPWGWWPLAFLGIGLLDQVLAWNEDEDPVFSRLRFKQGFLFGAAWIVVANIWVIDLSIPGYFVFALLVPLFYASAIAFVPTSSDIWRRVALVSVLVLVAVVRWSWPFGGVPLATLAMTQADAPLGPTVRTFGTLTLVALVGVVGVGVSALVDRHWNVAKAVCGIVAAIAVLTFIAPSGSPIGALDIAIVQGGGPQNTRAIYTESREVFDRHVAATRLIEGEVDVIVWPENVVDSRGPIEDNVEHAEMITLAREMGAPIIPGLTETFGGDDPYYTNASIFLDENGITQDRYDKVRIVPYGEYVPLRWLVEFAAPAALPSRDARPGTKPAVLETDLTTFGVSISWEIFFDTRAREAIQNGGTILLNPTNGSSYWLTIVQSQQIASSRLRAMETGRYVLQAAPTGFSAIVTPNGDVIDRSGVSEQKIIQGTVELREGITWAVRWGRAPMVLAALLGFALAVGMTRLRIRT